MDDNKQENQPTDKPVEINVVDDGEDKGTKVTEATDTIDATTDIDATKQEDMPVDSKEEASKINVVDESESVDATVDTPKKAEDTKPDADDSNKVEDSTQEQPTIEEASKVEPAATEGPEIVAKSKEELSPVAQAPGAETIPETSTENASEGAQVEEAPKTAAVGVAASEMGKPAHPHRNNRRLAVVVTLVVAILLASTAVYVYMSTSSNTEETSNGENSNQNTSEGLPKKEDAAGTLADVDQTAQDVEEAVNGLNDASDFSEDDVSDTNLGL